MSVVLYNRANKTMNTPLFSLTLKVNKFVIVRPNSELWWTVQFKQYIDEIVQHPDQWHHQIFIETSYLVQVCQPI